MELTKERTMMISGGLSAFSLILALIADRPSCWLAALAMAVSTLGDALLAGYPACFAGIQNRLVKGGLIFLAAHFLYIRALVLSSGQSALSLLPYFALPFMLFLGLTVLHGALFYSRARSSVPRAFFAAAFFYLLTAGVHAAAAAAMCARSGWVYALNVAGALLFYLSDAILLAGKYRAIQGERINALIWLTYAPAQFCLAVGFFLARQAFV